MEWFAIAVTFDVQHGLLMLLLDCMQQVTEDCAAQDKQGAHNEESISMHPSSKSLASVDKQRGFGMQGEVDSA